MNTLKAFWQELKEDLRKKTLVKTLFFIGIILIGLAFLNSFLTFITTALNLPLRILLLLFSFFLVVSLIRKKGRTVQDYLITISIIFISLIYPTIAQNNEHLIGNAILISITIFLTLAIIILWNLAKKSTKVNRKRISFISIIMLVFFIITLYSWIYTLLIVTGSEGGLRFGGCDDSLTIPPQLNANEHTFYYSAITYTTVGYGDICPQGKRFRTIAALEAITGILSIPTFFYVITRGDEE